MLFQDYDKDKYRMRAIYLNGYMKTSHQLSIEIDKAISEFEGRIISIDHEMGDKVSSVLIVGLEEREPLDVDETIIEIQDCNTCGNHNYSCNNIDVELTKFACWLPRFVKSCDNCGGWQHKIGCGCTPMCRSYSHWQERKNGKS